MKKNWNTPKVTVYGSVESLTQKVKYFGIAGDSFFLTSGGNTTALSDYTSM